MTTRRWRQMTKQKTDRVVLNLQQNEAIELNKFIGEYNTAKSQLLLKISMQLARTTAKNKAIENLRKTGPEPTKEEVNKALIAAGVRKAREIKKADDAIGAVVSAAQEVINEREANEKCPSCGSIATLPEPDGTLLCEQCGAIFKEATK